ncbi:hypothetical protein JCGZ_22383 [Jatropha curcas]|uniref:Uncharacterized protein n=1 Tax=Jatropha curcas TaxID=180498 RepID=A0A067L5N2_JATCU|nr:hypothetical protein JCGZ_22383 [Jatropha curcas]
MFDGKMHGLVPWYWSRNPMQNYEIQKILTGVIKPEGVAKLNALDMASDERKLENKKIAERSARKRLIERKEEDEKGTTKKFKCGNKFKQSS